MMNRLVCLIYLGVVVSCGGGSGGSGGGGTVNPPPTPSNDADLAGMVLSGVVLDQIFTFAIQQFDLLRRHALSS